MVYQGVIDVTGIGRTSLGSLHHCVRSLRPWSLHPHYLSPIGANLGLLDGRGVGGDIDLGPNTCPGGIGSQARSGVA